MLVKKIFKCKNKSSLTFPTSHVIVNDYLNIFTRALDLVSTGTAMEIVQNVKWEKTRRVINLTLLSPLSSLKGSTLMIFLSLLFLNSNPWSLSAFTWETYLVDKTTLLWSRLVVENLKVWCGVARACLRLPIVVWQVRWPWKQSLLSSKIRSKVLPIPNNVSSNGAGPSRAQVQDTVPLFWADGQNLCIHLFLGLCCFCLEWRVLT